MAEFDGKPLSESLLHLLTRRQRCCFPMRYLTESVVLKWDHDFDVVRAKLMVLYLN